MDRRKFLQSTAALASVSVAAQTNISNAQPTLDKRSEVYWKTIIDQYEVAEGYNNLNAGHWGLMSVPVMEAYFENTRKINRDYSLYVGSGKAVDPDRFGNYWQEADEVVALLAKKLNVGADELVLTRNITESMQLLFAGYNKLKPGDSVIFTDTDYGSMQAEVKYLEERRGANVISVSVPDPASYQGFIDFYEKVIKDNPTTKLMLLTHMSSRTGVIAPVREIIAMAKSYGVTVILDVAHSWGQFDFDFGDFGADFAGFNLHKWIGAPLGLGLMYIRKDRILDIDPKSGKGGKVNTEIKNRIQTGTVNMPAVITVPKAIEFQDSIGIKHIGRRFRDLRNQWVNQMIDDDRFEALTPQDERMYAGITSFRLKTINSNEGYGKLHRTLLSKYKINANPYGGMRRGGAIRVSPALYSSKADMDALAAALKDILG